MVHHSGSLYNPDNSPDKMKAVCEREFAKGRAAGGAAGGGRRLVIVSGVPGSAMRAMSNVLAALPETVLGPLSSIGNDSAVVQLPNYISRQHGIIFASARAMSRSLLQQRETPPASAAEEYLQRGVCQTIRAIWTWRDTCHPQATHA